LHLDPLMPALVGAALAILILLCFDLASVTGLLGFSTALGAFVAGILLGITRETQWIHKSLKPFRVVAVAVFFVSVGILLDVDLLSRN